MMHAEIHGNNQGISKLYDVTAPGGLKYNAEAGQLAVERDSPLGCVVNGNQRSGMVALSKAVELCVAKAKRSGGLAVVGTYNTATSTGMLAYYAAKVPHDSNEPLRPCPSQETVHARAHLSVSLPTFTDVALGKGAPVLPTYHQESKAAGGRRNPGPFPREWVSLWPFVESNVPHSKTHAMFGFF
mmetsp:Transcript_64975/g.146589  ORF Transcript_64975/g.146589 Transcript_64975/m.146589 type:complete len:185 (+) Transcript_64975:257-811(+)